MCTFTNRDLNSGMLGFRKPHVRGIFSRSPYLAFLSVAFAFFAAPLASSPYQDITDQIWSNIVPHLVTDSHPAKIALDKLFLNDRNSVYSLNALIDKGFYPPKITGQHVYALFHKELPGYLIKIWRPAYHGFTPKGNDWQSWLIRIEGAESVREAIAEHGYSKYFIVPKKWIYALPPDTSKKDPVNFILVVEDMNLVDKMKNHKYYQKHITKKHLRGIFQIVTTVGLSDGCSHTNLIWTKEKKLAFIDTESNRNWPVHYQRLLQYLPATLRKWWNNYLRSKGEDPDY